MSVSPLPSISESNSSAGSPSISTITFGSASDNQEAFIEDLKAAIALQTAFIEDLKASIALQAASIALQAATITRQEAAITALMERLAAFDTRPPA